MKTTTSLFTLLFSILFMVHISAQNQQSFEHKVQSKAFETERTIRVFLPERYYRDSTSKYIVVYVLDAHDDQVWNMATGVIDYMVSRYTVIPMIAVGIASEDRGSEFNPNSNKLHQHFREDVFPLIENNYRTKPHRTIIGHSWGGAFVGNTLFSENADMFDAYLGISPSFDAIDNVIFNQADSLLQLNNDFKKFFYYSSGTVGFEYEYKEGIAKMDSTLTFGKAKNLAWKSHVFKGKDHFSALPAGVNDGLVQMSRNYFADQKVIEDFAQNPNKSIKEQIDLFYAEKEKIFGFTHRPSVSYLKFVADELRDKDHFKAAIEIYLLGLENEKDNVKITFNLADTYHKMGKFDLAEPIFKSALVLLDKQKDNFSENYYKNISAWANKILEEYKK